MRTRLAAIALLALLPAAVPPASAQPSAELSEADRVGLEQIKEAVIFVYRWEGRYDGTVDEMIDATRQRPNVWSGTGNRDSEEKRVERVRELLHENREPVLDRAATALVEDVDLEALVIQMERLADGTATGEDQALFDQVQRAYWDAIFDTMMLYAVQANSEIEGG